MEGNDSILDTGDFATEPPSTPPPQSADIVKVKPDPKPDVPVGNDTQNSTPAPSVTAGDTVSLRYKNHPFFYRTKFQFTFSCDVVEEANELRR